jgi:hypothetical protein
MIRGGGDFLIKLVARDTAHDKPAHHAPDRRADGLAVQTLQTIRTSRSLAGVPLYGALLRVPAVLLIGLTALRLLIAARLPLSPDEAYYWVWSRALPPATSTIADGRALDPPGTALAGDGALGSSPARPPRRCSARPCSPAPPRTCSPAAAPAGRRGCCSMPPSCSAPAP